MPSPAQSSYEADSAALYERSGAAAYGVSASEFAAVLDGILRKYLPRSSPHSSTTDLARFSQQESDFCAGLRLEELALARACAAGNERAWQDFISRYRQKLHSMALHITRDSAHAADLADSLFADLYGINARDGVRNSKLVFYTGRGSLEGWLRTVMAQEFVNRYRKQKRTVSLEEQTEEGVQFAAVDPQPEPAGDDRLEAATDEALTELSSEDRFTLASYFLDRRTLAEIARTLGIHESSVSRRLDRLATGLRKRILSHAQAAEAMETDVRDLRVNLRSRLTQDSGPNTFPDSRKIPAQDAGEGSND
jgi:RNA polymerase sigma-70 factor (ECF subfamily)